MPIVEPGKTYMVEVSVRNDSLRKDTNLPTPATFGVGIIGIIDSTLLLIPRQVTQEKFAAGETRAFTWNFTVPLEAQTVGGIIAWLEQPNGVRFAFWDGQNWVTETTAALSVMGRTIILGGMITDIETRTALAGVTIELRSESGQFIQSTSTGSDGRFLLNNIALPATYVFAFSKAGYKSQVTQPLYFSIAESGGSPFAIEMVPAVPITSILSVQPVDYFWYLHDKNMGLLTGFMLSQESVSLPRPTGPEVYNIVTMNQQFGNKYFWGPFLLDLSAGGPFVLNPSAKTLNGAPVISLRNTQGEIIATVTDYLGSDDPDDPNVVISIRIDQANSPGAYWLGEVITVVAPYVTIGKTALQNMGRQVRGVLKMGTGTIGEPRWLLLSLEAV